MNLNILKFKINLKQLIGRQETLTGASYIKDVSKDNKHMIETFAINDKFNKNSWKANWEGIKDSIETIIDKPGVYYIKCTDEGCSTDHPETPEDNLERILKSQKPYIVSNIVSYRLDENTKTAYATHEILDKEFGKLITDKKIRFVSPGILPKVSDTTVKPNPTGGLPIVDTGGFDFFHIAFLKDSPAYGEDVATVNSECKGGIDCLNRLTASCSTGDCENTKLKKLKIRMDILDLEKN